MNFFFIPLGKPRKSLGLAKKAITNAASIEALAARWITGTRQIIISQNREMPFPCLGCSLKHGDDTLGIASIALQEALKHYAAVELLNEETFDFCDQEGFGVDTSWFQSRNEKLEISYDDALEHFVVPPKALGPLILSYALSSQGYAHISVPPRRSGITGHLHLLLVFLGKDLARGWHEELLVSRAALTTHTECSPKKPCK